MAEQVTDDKANVAENAAKVAEDRTAAETAAQTAQAVADSLPDDYVTAVAKIAENTADIASIKLTDKEMKRRVDALYDIGQGITHKFETDSETAYAKKVPTGAKLMSVKSVGGKSIVWNQLCNATNSNNYFINNNDGTITVKSGADDYFSINGKVFARFVSGHKYLALLRGITSTPKLYLRVDYASGQPWISTNKGSLFTASDTYEKPIYIRAYQYSGEDVNVIPQIFDLTQMFGSGNEPSTVEEFEKMFPVDYYPYNAGEIVSAGVTEVVKQGRNLFDCYGFSCTSILNVNVERKLNNSYGTTISTVEPTNKIVVTQSQAPESVIAHVNNGWFCVGIKGMEQSKRYTFSFDFTATKMLIQNPILQILVNGRFPGNTFNISELNVKKRVSFKFEYTKLDDRQYIELRLSGMSGIFENFQLDEGSTATAYTPYYTPISYTIPETIRNLPGYGWSAGTARNYVDYENKKYVQCVDIMDLGKINWAVNSTSVVGEHFYGFVDSTKFKRLGVFSTTVHNILCSKYIAVARNPNVFVDKTITLDGDKTAVTQIQVKDTAYPDATAFKHAMSGVILYYELAEPIVTDISSLIPDDFLRNIEVEALGSITFKNSNDNYHIPVPSEEEYVVKLSEVGGTT